MFKELFTETIYSDAWKKVLKEEGLTQKKFDKLSCEDKKPIVRKVFNNSEMSTPTDELVSKWLKDRGC